MKSATFNHSAFRNEHTTLLQNRGGNRQGPAAPKRKHEPARGVGGRANKKAKKGKKAAAAAALMAAEAASLEEENPEIAKLARQQKVGGK